MSSSIRRKATVIALLCVLAHLGAEAWKPREHLLASRPPVELATLFPVQFGDWSLDSRMPVQLVSPDTEALLNKIYSQTLSRTYVNPRGYRVMLSVAYGGDQSDATRTHRPEVCYPAQGFQLLSAQRTELSLPTVGRLPVKRLVTKLGERVEPLTYWVMVGEHPTTSGTEQKLAQLGYTTRGVIPDGMLIRVSAIDGEIDKSFSAQVGFLDDLAKALGPQARALVFGSLVSSPLR